ncbi:50S ribosomal protein L19 [Patescibacteria group bacterium]|nr:50S ribosomal protein L19 [Patescibacteria group bacterium]
MEDRTSIGIKSGDTVRVYQKIQDKGKTRIQLFEGLVLARKHGNEAGGTFTVRKVVDGIGVEKIFPLYSPLIDKIEIIRRAKVRRSKLYHIREKVAREARRLMRRMTNASLATESGVEVEQKRVAKAAADKAEEEAKAAALAAEAKAAEEAEAARVAAEEALNTPEPEVPAEAPEETPTEEKKEEVV